MNKLLNKSLMAASLAAIGLSVSLMSHAERPGIPQGIEPETVRMIADNENIASLMIVCTKPGVIPVIALEGGSGISNFILFTSVEMKFNDGPWEPVIGTAPSNDYFKTKTSKRTFLPGGLILVDRIAKAKTVKARWSSKDQKGETVLTTFNTTVAKSNADLKKFITKQCGVLGLK